MIHIRRCRVEDFDVVILLLRQLWADKSIHPDLLRPIFESALASESNTYLCATFKSRVIGFGSCTLKDNLWPEGRLAYVDELVVDSGFRGKGIGAQMLEQLVRFARDNGCCRIELVSAFYRGESHVFYERQGFARRAFVFSKVL